VLNVVKKLKCMTMRIGINVSIMFILILGICFARVLTKMEAITLPRVQSDRMIMLYRGIPMDHPFYNYAAKGIAKPFGGHTSIKRHRNGDTNSKFCSWSTNSTIAVTYATHDKNGVPCDGIVLAKVFSSKELIEMGCHDIYNEDEYLTLDIISGATVIPVIAKETKESFAWKLRN